jgi:hypothetical protein
MIPSAEISEASLVGPQGIGDLIPSSQIQVLRLDRGPEQPHPTSAIGNGELTPIRLPRQNSSTGRKRRLTGARVRKKNDLLRLEVVRKPRVELPERLG